MLLGTGADPPIKHGAGYQTVKRIQLGLHIQLPHLREEPPDALVVLALVQQHEFHIAGGHKRGDGPLVEPVDRPQVHGIFLAHRLLNRIQARVGNHLDHVAILPSAHLHRPARRVLRDARCPGQRRQRPGKRRRRPGRQVRRQRRDRRRRRPGRVVRQRVDRRVRRGENKEMVGHDMGRERGGLERGTPVLNRALRVNSCKQMPCFRPLLRPLLRSRLAPSRPFSSSRPLALHPRPPPPRPRSRSLLGYLDRIPHGVVFWGIIVANGAVFCLWQAANGRAKMEKDPTPLLWMYENFTNSIGNLKSGRLWTIITSTFSHQDVSHIFFNMFTFYFMGNHLLQHIGNRQFLLLYLGGGIVTSLTSMAYSHFVKHRDRPAHGASGAVYSVLAVIACAAPKLTFQLYGIIPVPAWLVVSGVFAWDSYNTINDSSGTTDSIGHIGGLLAGVGYYMFRRYRLF